MLRVEYGDIYLTRGDTACFRVQITQPDGSVYALESGDVLTFTIKSSEEDAKPVVQKQGALVVLEAEDTAKLDYGVYRYDVQLSRSNGNLVQTVLGPAKFYVCGEVTF